MIEASFEAVVPKAINAEFEAIIPREKAFDIVNKDIHIDTNGRYEVKADAGTAMTRVNVEIGVGLTNYEALEEKDVNFYDYDGALLFSYAWEDAKKLTELPTPPNRHDGLVFDGWNYTLEEMLEQGNYANIGAMYTTDNGRTKIKAKPKDGKVVIPINTRYGDELIIYWGDGSEEKVGEYIQKEYIHEYEDNLAKTIEIETVKGGFVFDSHNFQLKDYITEINFGNGDVVIGYQGFRGIPSLKTVSFNKDIVTINSYILPLNGYIKCVCIPPSQTLSAACIGDCHISIGSIPLNFVNYTYVLSNNNRILNFTVHSRVSEISTLTANPTVQVKRNIKVSKNNPYYENSVHIITKDTKELLIGGASEYIDYEPTAIAARAFAYTENDRLYIPDSVTTIGRAAFYYSWLSHISLGENVENIAISAFNYTTPHVGAVVDVTRCKTVPVLAGVIKVKAVIVPDDKYEEYASATNWASLPLIKKSESFYNVDFDVVFHDYNAELIEGYITSSNVGEKQSYDNIIINASFKHCVIPLQGECVLKIKGRGGISPRLFCFIDENDIVLSVAEALLQLFNHEVVVPQNAKKVLINTSDYFNVQLGVKK